MLPQAADTAYQPPPPLYLFIFRCADAARMPRCFAARLRLSRGRHFLPQRRRRQRQSPPAACYSFLEDEAIFCRVATQQADFSQSRQIFADVYATRTPDYAVMPH